MLSCTTNVLIINSMDFNLIPNPGICNSSKVFIGFSIIELRNQMHKFFAERSLKL